MAVRAAARDRRIRVLALRSPNLTGAEASLPDVDVPALLVVGEHDTPIRAGLEPLVSRLRGPHSLDVIPGGDHLFEDAAARARATAACVSWFRDHLK
ncbi:MAG: hypothetical protein HYR86_15800 [Candidatus Rokubacteria bacterium]|nr:hypothetical protein [Candidatus Rokubacteria bacterium]